MDIVGRVLACKRGKHNPKIIFYFLSIKNNLCRKIKILPISVKNSIFIDLKNKKRLSVIMKTIYDILKQAHLK